MTDTPIATLINTPDLDASKLFFDWFCKESAIKNKAIKLFRNVKGIANSSKFDATKCSVCFKNNYAWYSNGAEGMYDDFRICDIESGDVIFCVTPRDLGSKIGNVYGKENDFSEPLFEGTWMEIKRWFNGK